MCSFVVGQPHTCRLYGQTNHLASTCDTISCFNCKKTGHFTPDCPCPVYCNICKSPAHQARSCPFSWSRLVEFPESTSETTSSNTEHSENTESSTSDNSTNDSSADENSSDPVNISSPVLDNVPVDQPSDQPSETSPMDDDSLTPLGDSIMDQHSSDSTIQDFASASEENTMELFTEPQTSSRPAGNGRKPAKILDVFTPFRKRPAPTLVTSKPVRKHSPDSDELSPKPKKPNTSCTNKQIYYRSIVFFYIIFKLFWITY